jgi:hypothetical protein
MHPHLTESYTLDYQLLDGRMTKLEQETREFEAQCIQMMAVLHERVKCLQALVKRLLGTAAKHTISLQSNRALTWEVKNNTKKANHRGV